jgi:hypothetical protein
MHASTFEYLKPTDDQMATMELLREAARDYAHALITYLPEGPDKTHVLRQHRTTAMWANISVTRNPDGSPRE